MASIRFIHAADLHLDSPFKGMTEQPQEMLEQLRESTFAAFDQLINYAVETKPDFVLIVGDVYDGEERSLKAQMRFQSGMEKLNDAAIPVFVTYGNHDHLNGKWTRFALPANVFEFGGQVEDVCIDIRGRRVVLHGFSYAERHIKERMIDSYPVAEDRDVLHIGLLHGSAAGDETHAVYAPFTIADLVSKRYDYWALGHIHKRQILHEEPMVVYSGNLQGRHRNERGSKGFYEVELDGHETKLNFVSTSSVVFERVEVSCKGIQHANEWFSACMEAIDSFTYENGSAIVEIILTDVEEMTMELFSQSGMDEWLHALREMAAEREPFAFVQKIHIVQTSKLHAAYEPLVESVLQQIDSWTTEQWKGILEDLYGHAQAGRFLDRLHSEDLMEIRKDAEKLLYVEMSKLK